MINIASSQPVHWPVSSTAVTVVPVAAVSAVTPAQRSQGEGQSGMGSDRQDASARNAHHNKGAAPDKATERTQAAPLLPRARSKEAEEASAAQTISDERPSAQEMKEAEEARSANTLKLMDVLSTVWQASAAVVDNALGRRREDDSGAKADAANAANAAGSASAANKPASISDTERRSAHASAADDGFDLLGPEPPVAYTEQGASEWSALEPGRLVNKRA